MGFKVIFWNSLGHVQANAHIWIKSNSAYSSYALCLQTKFIQNYQITHSNSYLGLMSWISLLTAKLPIFNDWTVVNEYPVGASSSWTSVALVLFPFPLPLLEIPIREFWGLKATLFVCIGLRKCTRHKQTDLFR